MKIHPHQVKFNIRRITLIMFLPLLFVFTNIVSAQETISPPNLGDNTKGSMTTEELNHESNVEHSQIQTEQSIDEENSEIVKEHKRESGQLYLIELTPRMGAKQYIEEHGSDTKLESTSNDIEETPNLAKWKLGSW